MRSRSRRVTSVVAALASTVLVLAATGAIAPAAQAQDAQQSGEELFGNYDLEARGLGVQARYEIEGLLPGGSPVLDLTLPETLARFTSGPTGYGLASLAYPGGLIVNLASLVAQTGTDSSSIPDYPVKAETFYPSGPTDASAQAVGDQVSRATQLGVDAMGTYPGIDADPVINVDSVSSASRSDIEGGKAVARTRVVLGGVTILGGVITIDSLVTDLVAAHDGTNGTANGGTTATGVKFLGLAASLTKDGLVLEEAPPAQGPAGALGTILNPLVSGLQQLTAPVQALVQQVLKQAVPSLDDVLSAAGLNLELLSGGAVTTDSGASAYRSTGLALDLSYKGAEQAALGQLIDSIPPDLRPNIGPLPNPISFLVNNHIASLTLGTGTVSALASSPFDSEGDGSDGGVDLGGSGSDLGSFDDGGAFDPGFSTPIASPPTGSNGRQGLGATLEAVASRAVPGTGIALILLGAACITLLTRRFADDVLAASSNSCPSGLDQPPPPPRDP
jgi:hypothetical protein